MVRVPDAGWSSLVARWAHNPKVEGSNPSPATKTLKRREETPGVLFLGCLPRFEPSTLQKAKVRAGRRSKTPGSRQCRYSGAKSFSRN
jgi:hypothetical protein